LTNFANFLGKISKCSISKIWGKKQEKKKRALEWIKTLVDWKCIRWWPLWEPSLARGEFDEWRLRDIIDTRERFCHIDLFVSL
jgi:hypothetical protein